jgi:hypothetical protein
VGGVGESSSGGDGSDGVAVVGVGGGGGGGGGGWTGGGRGGGGDGRELVVVPLAVEHMFREIDVSDLTDDAKDLLAVKQVG